jgi:uncharacterized protein YbjQ (UPF0145 family)
MYQLIFIFLLLIMTYFIGTYREKKHYASIIEREKKLNKLPAIAIKTPPSEGNFHQQLVLGNVTISVDYFKRFLAGLHNFFGGRITSYESLLDRARREALLRMKEAALECNATLILNIKYETASIYKGSGSGIGSVEVLAYGTALIPQS